MSEDCDWRYVYASVIGVTHVAEQIDCQDVCQVALLSTPSIGPVLLLAAADGAGSAAQARIGAELACQALLTACEAYLTATPVLDWTPDTAKRLFENVQHSLSQHAAAVGAPLREFACTLLGAMVATHTALFLQIGDGAIIIRRRADEQYQPMFWPQSGQYVNETRFTTDSDALSHLECAVLDEIVTEIALLTDGLQMLALDYPQRRAHAPFFQPLFSQLRTHPDMESAELLLGALAHFLGSPAVNQRTHDDKTLILATRLPPVVSTTVTKTASTSEITTAPSTDSTVIAPETVIPLETTVTAADSNTVTPACTDPTDADAPNGPPLCADPSLVRENHGDEVT
jgi:hypothetical protein